MDPPTSFKIPVLLRRRGVSETLNSKLADRLNSSLAFKDKNEETINIRKLHEISPRLNMTLNPGYRMEYSMARSEMKTKFPNYFRSANNSFLTNDKVFYKKKDELVNYTEHFFKNKILYSKK